MKHPTPAAIPSVKRGDLAHGVRDRIREAIEAMLEEELAVALGALKGERIEERRGYRHGKQERTVTTECGAKQLNIPRGRIATPKGEEREWRSVLLPAYQRRMRRVDEAILGVYLAGANTRRIRRALEPVFGEAHLSRSAISRVVGRLKESFEAWRHRDLSGESYAVIYLDAIYLAVRLARRVVRVPVEVVLGVKEDGQKVVVAMQIAMTEGASSWAEMVRSLGERGLEDPVVVIVDGGKGVHAAIEECWPEALVQRCTKHKLENLLQKVPKHAHAELKRDYRAITHALDGERALRAYEAFLVKWRKLCPAAAESLEEAELELMTFYRFPRSQWKSLRTTNVLENVNGQFRRRVKTQGSLPNESSALVVLYGLLAFGQITMRKIDGWKAIPMMRDVAMRAA